MDGNCGDVSSVFIHPLSGVISRKKHGKLSKKLMEHVFNLHTARIIGTRVLGGTEDDNGSVEHVFHPYNIHVSVYLTVLSVCKSVDADSGTRQ